jgi:hypothetical protein
VALNIALYLVTNIEKAEAIPAEGDMSAHDLCW